MNKEQNGHASHGNGTSQVILEDRGKEEKDNLIYKVVINHEEQYSIWPAGRENPSGWKDAGKDGDKEDCLNYIEEVWTDMRPLSLRKKMQEDSQPDPNEEVSGEASLVENPSLPEDDLVHRLTDGIHPVEAVMRPAQDISAFKECIDRRYIQIRFTDTRGETELGFPLDSDQCDLAQADLENQTGTVRLSGRLSLNYVHVRCVAEIDVQTFNGTGHLEIEAA